MFALWLKFPFSTLCELSLPSESRDRKSLMSIEVTVQPFQPSGSLPRARTILFTVFGFVLLFLFCSPNFQSGSEFRATPLGSDFLQEWTGGYIWLNHRADLYDAERFVAVQHDPAIVGFGWPHEQYYPMVYPPFYYMLLSPLAKLPYAWALTIWMLAIGGAIAATLCLWARFYPAAQSHWGKCLLATLAFFPLLMCFNTAHKSTFLLLILTGTYLLLYHRKPFASGALFGLIAFKPHLGLVIGIAMLLKRQWNFVAGCAVTVATLLFLSLLAGWDLCQAYFWQCLSMSDYSSTSGYLLTESHNLIGAAGLLFGTDSTFGAIVFWVMAAGLMAIVGFGMKGSIQTDSKRFALQFSMLVIATVLLSPHFYVYDLTILLLPIGLVVFELGKWQGRRTLNWQRQWLLASCLGLFVFTGLSKRVAEVIGVQPTVLLLIVAAVLLATSPNWYDTEEDRSCVTAA